MRKRWLSLGVIAGLILLLATAASAGVTQQYKGYQVVRVVVNGREVQSDVPALILDGRTVLPVRAVADALGMTMGWDQASQTVTLTGGSSQKFGPTYLMVTSQGELNRAVQNAATWLPNYDGLVLATDTNLAVYRKADFQAWLSNSITTSEYVRRADLYVPSTSGGAPSATTPLAPGLGSGGKILIIGQDGDHTYLGTLSSSEFASESTCNKIGRYGNSVSFTSIWNSVGQFGNEVSSYSAFNDIASKPPQLVQNGKVVGYLTTNIYKAGAISPLGLCQRLGDVGL